MARFNLQQKIASLDALSRPELAELWVKQYGCPPPSGVRQPLLIRAAAWHLQTKYLGGLSSNARRLLKAAVRRAQQSSDESGDTVTITAPVGESKPNGGDKKKAHDRIDSASGVRALPPPGARLIRDWNGRRYVVEVVDGGFVMDGKPYRSLTAIAFRITGAKWSGPRFFGL